MPGPHLLDVAACTRCLNWAHTCDKCVVLRLRPHIRNADTGRITYLIERRIKALYRQSALHSCAFRWDLCCSSPLVSYAPTCIPWETILEAVAYSTCASRVYYRFALLGARERDLREHARASRCMWSSARAGAPEICARDVPE